MQAIPREAATEAVDRSTLLVHKGQPQKLSAAPLPTGYISIEKSMKHKGRHIDDRNLETRITLRACWQQGLLKNGTGTREEGGMEEGEKGGQRIAELRQQKLKVRLNKLKNTNARLTLLTKQNVPA